MPRKARPACRFDAWGRSGTSDLPPWPAAARAERRGGDRGCPLAARPADERSGDNTFRPILAVGRRCGLTSRRSGSILFHAGQDHRGDFGGDLGQDATATDQASITAEPIDSYTHVDQSRVVAIFAPKLAKAQTKAAVSSSSAHGIAHERWTPVAHRSGHGSAELRRVLCRGMSNQAMLRLLAQPGRSLTGNERGRPIRARDRPGYSASAGRIPERRFQQDPNISGAAHVMVLRLRPGARR